MARDITSHKQGEAVSRLSEKRVLIALKHAPVVVITQDLQLRLKWITPPVSAWDYRDLLGSTDAGSFGAWDNRRFLGSTEAEILGEEQGARVTAIKQEVIRTGEGSRTEVAVTFEGVTRHFDLMVEPFRDARGTLLGVTSSAIDITSWKYQIAKLKEALDQVAIITRNEHTHADTRWHYALVPIWARRWRDALDDRQARGRVVIAPLSSLCTPDCSVHRRTARLRDSVKLWMLLPPILPELYKLGRLTRGVSDMLIGIWRSV